MSARLPHFEIVWVEGGRFVRFVGANGRIVWVTPGLLSRRLDAFRAIELLSEGLATKGVDGLYRIHIHGGRVLRIDLIDERSAA